MVIRLCTRASASDSDSVVTTVGSFNPGSWIMGAVAGSQMTLASQVAVDADCIQLLRILEAVGRQFGP